MKIITAILLLILSSSYSFSQRKKEKKKIYIAEIYDMEENFIVSGALYDINDSAIILSSSDGRVEYMHSFQVPVYYIKTDILTIKKLRIYLHGISFGVLFFRKKIEIRKNRETFFQNKELIKKYCFVQ